MSDIFRETVLRLSRVPGLSGALVVETAAGVPVAAELRTGVSGTAVAALAAALFERTAQASEAAGYRALQTLQLDAEHGHMLIAGAGELLVVALVADDTQMGRIRMEAQRAARELLAEPEAGA
jgi:predicted regulator of Ras-like GTPase activity (Roadblock/LC7/MglB family)